MKSKIEIEEEQDRINLFAFLKTCFAWMVLGFPLDAGAFQFLNAFLNGFLLDTIYGLMTIFISISLMVGSIWYFWTKRGRVIA